MKTRSGAEIFLVHDNGGRPFKVWYKHPMVQVFSMRSGDKLLNFRTDRLFVGISPENVVTEYGLGFGPRFDGNTILASLAGFPGEYIFIGWKIYRFTALAPIVEYLSPVGNNDVPYPWALDAAGNFYLMTENVILLDNETLRAIPKDDQFDPYSLYYDEKKTRFVLEDPITKKKVKFMYDPDPGALFDRLSGFEGDFPEVKDWKLMGKEVFCTTVLNWGWRNGYLPIGRILLVPRDIWSSIISGTCIVIKKLQVEEFFIVVFF